MVACAWYVLILSETSSNFCCCGLDHDFAQVFDKLASTAEGGTMDSVWQIVSWSFNCMQAGKWPKRDHLGHLWLSLHHAHFLQPRINQNRRPCNEPMLLACKVSERKSSCQKSWKAIGWQVGCLHHWFAGRSGLPKFISQAASMEQCYFTMCPMQVHKKREYHLEELAAKCRLDCYLLETS